MRTTQKSKFIAIALFSGLMLSLAASPAKAGDLSIGIGLNLGHPHSYYPDSYAIHYRDYDRHRHHHYHDKHWKHHKKHWKHHDRHYSHRGHYDKHRYHNGGRHADYRDYRRHDRYDGGLHHYRH